MEDLRDIRGRLVCLAVASPLGIAIAVTIALVIPDRDHTPNWTTCFPKPEGRAVSSVIVGAVAITLALYSIFRRIRRG